MSFPFFLKCTTTIMGEIFKEIQSSISNSSAILRTSEQYFLMTLGSLKPFSYKSHLLCSIKHQLWSYQGYFTYFKPSYQEPTYPTIQDFKRIRFDTCIIAIVLCKLNQQGDHFNFSRNQAYMPSSYFLKFELFCRHVHQCNIPHVEKFVK